ncbi:fibronectin type III domain-containing protein [Microbulbifer sp. ZKSA002]|uniref:fibronectin type III domain-containing protein n=1 Tax=Microbulbifer sp. ZKSA002 TaxID=3243388 RepID=UPI00403982B0
MKSYLSAVCILATIFWGELAYTADTSTLQSSGNVSSTEIETITISSDTQITPEDKSLDGKHLRIDGAILTIDGAHTFSSLILENNATLTHSISPVELLSLTINGDIEIQSGSKIDVSALGTLSTQLNCSGCGGAHASYGGGRGQEPYGDYVNPKSLGSGGSYTADEAEGTRGGGAVQIQAQSLLLDGSIDANGQSLGGYYGGASGGSILLEVQDIDGSGSISANGGTAHPSYSYGGSGGRIAIYHSPGVNFDFINQVSAIGGSGKSGGGPGSLYLHDGAVYRLRIKNSGGEYGGIDHWTAEQGTPGVRVASQQPAPGYSDGSYYLYGGNDNEESKFYQNISFPVDQTLIDSIGRGEVKLGLDWIQSSWSSDDKGEVVFRFLNSNGQVVSEQASGLVTTAAKIWEKKHFSAQVPSGAVSVDLILHSQRYSGSNNDAYFDRLNLKLYRTTQVEVTPNYSAGLLVLDNYSSGSNVEKYILAKSIESDVLLKKSHLEVIGDFKADDNLIRGDGSSYVTVTDNISGTADNFIVDGYSLSLTGGYSFKERFDILGGWIVTSEYANNASLPLSISASDIFIGALAKINLSGRGLEPLEGSYWKSGGSYGGLGGKDPSSGITNSQFGNLKKPADFGVGGYGADSSIATRGGGAIKLIASNKFEVYGDIYAKGETVYKIGSGSGGSIWIEAGDLIGGSGTEINASGGNGYYAASGGGGRIAVYYDTLTGFDPKTKIKAFTGNNSGSTTAYGGAGTVYLYDKSLSSDNELLQIVNISNSTSYAPYSIGGVLDIPLYLDDVRVIVEEGAHLASSIYGSSFNNAYVTAEGDFTVANNDLIVDGFTFELPQDYSFGSITVQNSGKITTPVASDTFTSGITLSATDFYISSNSYIDVSSKGLGALDGEHWKSGGSYGGLGGKDPLSGTTNAQFGNLKAPTDFGVGGYGADSSVTSTRGGGAIKLIASNKFEVYGDIYAKGEKIHNIGSGSGGSIWIEAGDLIGGSGTEISAAGGNGYYAASGGGGRIAIYYDTLTGFDPKTKIKAFTGNNSGSTTAYGGAGTVYLYDKSLSSDNELLQIVNISNSTSYAPYSIGGVLDIPLYLDDVRVIVEEGAHLASSIYGSSFNNAYVTAEGDFTVANNDLIVDGFTFELPQDYSFGSITVQNSGKITTPVASDTFTSGITLSATDFYISSNSYIDVSSKGLGALDGEHWKSGGSYGGLGGKDPLSGTTNAQFGNLKAPTDFGVGGYGADSSVTSTRGGGAIKLIASNKFEVYGDIYAKGEKIHNIGSGSGGSIWIEAGDLIGGSGTEISAAGGNGYYAASGGGGRIAIYYDTLTGFDPKTKIKAFTGNNSGSTTAYGGAGTVYLYDKSLSSDNELLQIVNISNSTSYAPYSIGGVLDIPLYLDDVRVIVEEGAHLASSIYGSSFNNAYVTAEGDFTVANNDLIVDGFTFELPQDYSFGSITVQNSGKITTPVASDTFTSGITLSATDFYISSNSYIDVSSKGLGALDGEHWKSGGSYGGLGGKDPLSGTTNAQFGNLKAPTDFGVGGYGADSSVTSTRGGGAIKLIASNKFEVYGDIYAKGEKNGYVGSGSGGSIWIEAGELIGGSGTEINASGGDGYFAASGGGGRIAVYYDTLTGLDPKTKIKAFTGSSYAGAIAYGGAGTVYLYDKSLSSDNELLQIVNISNSTSYAPYSIGGVLDIPLYLDDVRVIVEEGAHLASSIYGSSFNNAYVTAEGDFTVANNDLIVDGFTLELPQGYSFGSITVQNSGKITTPVASDTFTSGITLSATDFYISSNSYIDVSSKGLLPFDGDHWKSGGSYGGLGGTDPSSGTVAPIFGSIEAPVDFGVGGYGVDATIEGSRGGGAIKLVASNRFEVYGDILAYGQYNPNLIGAGSGGSIWIEAKEIIGGSGTLIEASGGRGYNAATGGGGRIAIYYDSLSGFAPRDRVLAMAGSNYSGATAYGGAGTVYLFDRSLSSNNGELLITNRGVTGYYEPYRVSGQLNIPLSLYNTNVIIEDDAHLNNLISGSGYNSSYVKAEGDFTVANNSLIVDGFTLELSQDYSFENITLQNSAKITTTVASDTFTSGITLSATDFYISSNSYIDVSSKGLLPFDGDHWKSGGSYGGLGGTDPSSGTVAPIFGSIEAPVDFGVGGYGVDATIEGSRGGGAIKLVASNRFEVYGDILAYGQYNPNLIGAGSGGSIWIEAKEIIGGSGTLIEASGGRGYNAATGGGGRIAIYYDSLSGFAPRDRVLAMAGSNYSGATAYGGAGTVYLFDRSLSSNNGELLITNRGVTDYYEPYRVSGQLNIPLSLYNTNVIIEDDAHLNNLISGSGYNSSYVKAEGDFTVANNSLIVDGFTLELSQDYSFENITLQNSAKITTPVASDTFTSGITLSATDFYISSNSYIDVTGKGFLPNDSVGYQSGGSYGGLGGVYTNSETNPVYGSAISPIEFGMGGRYQDDSGTDSRGGGAIKIIADTLQHYGYIYASGTGNYGRRGGGSGGSVWLDIGELIVGGQGYIYANGGYGSVAGAGGGGRVATYYESLEGDLSSRMKADSGGRSSSGIAGEDGTVHIAQKTVAPRVRSITPSGYYGELISSAIVQFSIGIDTDTLDLNDIQLLDSDNNSIAATAITSIDDIRYQVDFEKTLVEGAYILSVGPDIFGSNGLGMDQDQDGVEQEAEDDRFTATITLDVTSPRAIVLDQPISPIVINSNSRWVTLSGNREDNTAITIGETEIAANGTGSWSGKYYAPEGQSTVEVRAKDLSGNLSDPVSLIFNVDSKAPNITGVNPTGSNNIAPPYITLVVTEEGSGIDVESSRLEVKRNGVSLSGSIDLFEGQIQFIPQAPFLDGDYEITAQVADKLGNTSSQSTYTFTLDYTPPVAPVLDAYPQVTTVNAQVFSGTKEADSAILVNGNLTVVNSSSTSWSTQVALLQGDNEISFTVRDAAGNVSDPSVAQIRYDNTPPGVVSPVIDPNGSGTEVTLDWSNYNEFDNGNDIAEYRIYQSAANFTDIAGKTPVATVVQGSKQYRVEGLPRGMAMHFAVVAYDSQGLFNPSVSSIAVTPVDTVAPDEITNLVVTPGADNLILSWNPSADSAEDLAGYRVVFTESDRVDDIPLSSLADPQVLVQYQVTGLSAATSYPLRVYVYDNDGNTSSGITDSGTTLLPNPASVTVEAKSSRIDLQWSSVSPYSLLKNYAVYVEENAFSSISGLHYQSLRNKGSESDTEHSWSMAGLENDKTYYVAVVSVNNSNGSEQLVTPVAVTPVADTDGPVISVAEYQQGGQVLDLNAAPELSKDGNFKITATDDSGVARVEFYLDGKLEGAEYTAITNVFTHDIALLNLADGDHGLTVKIYDIWENVIIEQYQFSVALAAPTAPQITSPSEGWLTNSEQVTIYGTAEKQTQVQVYLEGVPTDNFDTVDNYGNFQIDVSLQEGENSITVAAEYPGRGGYGAQSDVRKVNLDTDIPDAPSNVTVIERELGQISLSWDAVSSYDSNNQIAGYNVYRSNAEFTSVLEAERINTQLLAELKYSDLPTEDGEYFYAITAVNEAATEGSLSSLVEAKADSEGPHALQVSYQTNGLVDSASGRHGPGTVEVTVQFDEPLRNQPYFAMAPDGGVPVAVELSKDYSDDTLYTGSFIIEPGMMSGTAYAVMSAHDNVGNRGTVIEQGTSLLIDAEGPEVIALTLNPGEPLKVHEQDGLQVEVILQLSDEVKAGAMPELLPLVGNTVLPGLESGIILNRDAQSTQGQPLWVGSFTLPASAGQDEEGNPTVDTLRFSFLAEDDLENQSDKIRVANYFQVYQGDLPPLEIPQSLQATALPGGEVALQWDSVEGARYVLYRKAEGDADFTEVLRLSETSIQDTLPTDGNYYYGIASERRSNDQIAVSSMSVPVKVGADSIPPAAPTELALELNGAGIVATWQAPSVDIEGGSENGETLTYNLYRLALAEGENATQETLQSVGPLQTGIPDTIALDNTPSESEHAYVITALDEAGNESAPSVTAYLNFGLLPVSDLSIQVDANGNPQLQWNHTGSAISGYRVYVGEEGSLQEITSGLISHSGNPTIFVDSDFSAAEQGVNAERRYTVVAEDSLGATSIGHSLLLPALSVEVVESQEGESAIKRGVMNEVRFRVQNRGSSDISGVKLFATVNDNGAVREHQSVAFSVAAGGLVEIPIIVGGYDKLDTLSDIQLRLEQSPLPGETIFINTADQVLVGDAALRLDLETDTLYRGGVGKVRFTLENTSAVETEVLVARSNGSVTSDEVRVRIEDTDSNLLALQSVQQFTGDVITVATGETVARVQPGKTFVSDWIEVAIPAAAPDNVTIALEIDQFRYHTGKDTQVAIQGNGTRIQASLQETAYYGELDTVAPQQVYGTEEVITITGRALDRDSDAALSNVPLSLVMELRGFERSASVITDATGNFSYQFDPQGQSGNWQVSVIHPDSLSRPVQGEFAVLTSSVTPGQLSVNIPRNYTQEMPITVTAGHSTALSDVRLISVAAPGEEQIQIPSGLHLDLGAVIELAEQEKGVINLSLSGDNLAPDQGYLYFQVLASVNGIEQSLENVSLEYNLAESRPAINFTPSYVDSGVALGGTTTETIELKNTGFDMLRNTTLSLVDGEGNPAPTWVRVEGTAALGDLEIGEGRDINIAFSPDNTVPQGNYEYRLVAEGDGGYSFTLQLFVAVVTSEIGNAFFHISDIYTATLDENNTLIPGLTGARIELQNEQVLSETRTINSDANGEAFLQDLPAGRYAYRVTAFDHESVSGRLWVKPGATVAEDVFLMNQIVSVEWQVNEINLEDRYEITLEATFETQVPVAVVMLDPISVTLPDMQKGDVFSGELSLTNYGLIKAESMSSNLPSGNDVVSFEFLADVPEILEAGEVVYIPYRITALRDFNPSEEGDASGAGCGTYSYQYQVSYASECANGQVVPGGTSTHWGSASSGSCGSGGSSGGGGGKYYYGGGSGSGGGYGGSYSSISSDETLRCAPDPACDGPCNKDNTSPQ